MGLKDVIVKAVVPQAALMIVQIADSKVSGEVVAKEIDRIMDQSLIGQNASEKIQRTNICNLLREMIKGFYAEDEEDYVIYLERAARDAKAEYDKKRAEGKDEHSVY